MPPSDERTGDRPAPRSGERIAKLLARAGIASRREVERMIAEGRVKLGEELVTTPATVLPNLRGVTVDGKPVRAAEAARLFAFHKPAGLITAERDPAGRPTIYTALRNALPKGTPRLMPVGRLDLNTEGLLLLTNDGELKRAMELPSSGIPRTYRARTFGDISQNQLEELIEGVTIDGMRYGKIDANMERRTGRNQWVEMTLTEGKNREVRRVLEHLGLQVSRLLRTSYGPFVLGDLPRGATAEFRQVDVERFRKTLGGTASDLAPVAPPRAAAPASMRPAAPPRETPAPKPKRKPAGHPPPRDDRPPRPGDDKGSPRSATRRSPSSRGRRKP
jgi:23S rRNA pseudouridine2605 synthase